jgi:phytol kinase
MAVLYYKHMLFDVNLFVLAFACLGLWLILLFVEILTRINWMNGEYSRKSIHVYSGFFLAMLPLYANRTEIIVINCLFFIAVLMLSGINHYFKAGSQISRWSVGQFLYPIGILLVAILFKSSAIYSFAVLELALADGFAAVFGRRYGRWHYHILGANKTLLGSAVFFIISLTIMFTFVNAYGVGDGLSYAFVVAGALSLTLIEGAIGAGFDNLLIPMLTAAILSAL